MLYNVLDNDASQLSLSLDGIVGSKNTIVSISGISLSNSTNEMSNVANII